MGLVLAGLLNGGIYEYRELRGSMGVRINRLTGTVELCEAESGLCGARLLAASPSRTAAPAASSGGVTVQDLLDLELRSGR